MPRNSRTGYGLGSPLPALTPTPVISTRAPLASDLNFELGTTWIGTTTNQAWIMTGSAAGVATWSLSSPGASDVDTLTGDGGGAISPLAGNITLAGGTNITTAGAVNTITYNLDDAIALVTSVTSPLYTSGAAADVQITAPAGQDINIQMGDAAGANVINFNDSTTATVVSMDSNGVLTALAGLVVTGAFTQTAGIVNIGADAAANAINIGTGAAAKPVIIGSVNGASSLDLLCGTGNFSLEGNIASTYAISNVGVNTGQVDIAGGTGARAINIGAGGTGAKTIGIGAAASADVITIGDATGAGSLDLVAGTGNFSLEGNIATTYAISNVGVNTGQVDIAGGTGARTINIGAGGTGAKTIGIGAAASADIITIGDATGAGSLDLVCGTGNFTLEGNVASTYQISNTGANTGQIDVFGGTGARTVNIAGGGTGIKTINIGAAATADVITIGDATGAGSLDLVCGTGNMTLTSTGTGDITIDSDDTLLLDSDGVLELNSSAGVIGIGNDADAFAINVGTGAAARVITIGNVTGASQVVLNSGTAGVNINTTGAGDVVIDSDDTFLVDADGVLELNSSAGIIGIGNDADAFDINIGTGAAAREVTIGNVTGASGLTLLAGTGNIDVTGTFEDVVTKFATVQGQRVTFTQSPIGQSNLDTGVDVTGANGDLNIFSFQDGIMMEQFIIGTQTIICPRMEAAGLLTSLDLTATDGWELNFGAARANSRHSFTIGTSPAFFMELRFTLADVSGCEPFYFGFRRTQANNAAFANYTDFVGYGVNDGVAPGDCVIATQLNTGGLINTDTNDAFGDGTTHTLQVLVSAAGVTTFTFDGGAPTATQAFTFDNGDVVHPWIHNLFNAAIPGAIHFVSMEVGFQ